MKTNISFYPFIFGIILIFLFSCKKEDPKVIPSLSVKSVTNITATSATSGGEVTSDGGASVTSRGVCWSTNQNPTIADNKTSDGSGSGSFTSSITGLTPGTTYYLKAYAVNVIGIAYSNQVTITAVPLVPVLTTANLSNVTISSFSSGGSITDDGGGAVTIRGICWNTSQNPTIADNKTSDGAGTGSFTSSVTGLISNTIYYVRAYATNSGGTGYGNQTYSRTFAIPATITTTPVTAITTNGATSGGNIASDGTGIVTTRGVCWSTSHNPTRNNSYDSQGSGTGSFTSTITGLNPNTTYYLRAYEIVAYAQDYSYGNEVSFTTPMITGETVTDLDGNIYHTVTIGSQVWMAENLKTTKYRNGDQINIIADLWSLNTVFAGACCSYNFDDSNIPIFGRQYNGYAIKDSRNIAPSGWHIPTDAEWTALTTFLGPTAGGKLKESGTAHWMSPNSGATNEFGFTALPNGKGDGYSQSSWWSSTLINISLFKCRTLDASSSGIMLGQTNVLGACYVRCVKD